MKYDKLSMRLVPQKDRNGNTFYIGRLKYPGTITMDKGAVFLVFISEEGNEELQVAMPESSE